MYGWNQWNYCSQPPLSNKLLDISGNASSWWPFTFHNVLLCVALTRRIELNDVNLLERRDSHVLPFSRSRSVPRLHTHTRYYWRTVTQLHPFPFQFGSIIFISIKIWQNLQNRKTRSLPTPYSK